MLLPQARTRWMLPMAAMMTPRQIELILRGALVDQTPRREQELFQLMTSTWPRLLKNTEEVKTAVLGLDWMLKDAPEDERLPGARELMERARNGMKGDPCGDGHGWRSTLSALLDAWFRGVSISEIHWEMRGGGRHPQAWLPRQTTDVPPWHYGWDNEPGGGGRLRLYPAPEATGAVDFPPHKFLIGIRKAGKGHPSGTALLRCLAWFWCAANFSHEWLLNFAQIFGQPFRWATYAAGQDGVKDDLADMMERMGSAAYGVGPEGTKIEWHEAAKSGADNPQAYVLKLADEACDLLCLGQTLTGSVGDSGSRALGEVHQDVRSDIIDAAAAWLAEVLNEQLIPAIVAVNLGDQGEDAALPFFEAARKSKKDSKAVAETIQILLASGVPLVRREVYEMIDMSEPAAGDETLGGAPAAPPPVPGGGPAATDLQRFIARLPVDAREYFLARLIEKP